LKKLVLLFVLFLMLFVSDVNALSITPSTTGWTTNINSNLSESQIANLVGYSGDLTLLYKQDVGSTIDSGVFSNSYSTTFSPLNDPSNANIVYIGGNYISGSPIYLYVKDGRHIPAAYIFDLNALGWNGTDSLNLSGFWPGGGSISHVSMYGTNPVPEPTTLLLALILLGSGLLGLVVSRKRIN